MGEGVPWAERPWDQVIPNLWIGGHRAGDEAVVVADEFDIVFSLFRMPGYGPSPGIRDLYFQIEDADLDPEVTDDLDAFVGEVIVQLQCSKKVLVRCSAGINRSALVVALVLVAMGWSADDALKRLRHVRSPDVLFNQSFVNYLREVEARR